MFLVLVCSFTHASCMCEFLETQQLSAMVEDLMEHQEDVYRSFQFGDGMFLMKLEIKDELNQMQDETLRREADKVRQQG